MYGGLYSFAKSFDEKIGWGRVGVLLSVAIIAVHGCNGRYMEVTATPVDGKPLRGWSFSPCSLQLTTCDGGVVE